MKQPPARRVWATHIVTAAGALDRDHPPCIWGSRQSAIEGRDDDEAVVRLEYRVLHQLSPRAIANHRRSQLP